MANKVFDFLFSLLNEGGGTNKGASGAPNSAGIDQKSLSDFKEKYKTLTDTIDDLNKKFDQQEKAVKVWKKSIDDTTDHLMKSGRSTEDVYSAVSRQSDHLVKSEKALSNIRGELEETEGRVVTLIDTHAKKIGVTGDQLRKAAVYNTSLNTVLEQGTTHTNLLAKSLGLSNSQFKVFAEVFGALAVITEGVTAQIIKLNDKLIPFQRTMSGTLNAGSLGFDRFGNNQTSNIGSVQTLSAVNNISVDQFLETFKAFSGGQIIGLTQNLKDSQLQLQEYGISVGRISKLYGVSSDTLAGLTQTLTQNFGVKIKDVTSIMEEGSNIALQAGVSVGKFFDNMKQIADLNGDVYIKNGAKGIEQTAFALSKLGLGAGSLTKVSESMKSFTDIFDKQNRAAALGLSGYSGAAAKIFAKTQTGDLKGALSLQQISLAGDIKRTYGTDKGGNINAQGIQALQGIGMGKDEIQSIQRLIRYSSELGKSFSDVVNETNLSTVELAKKRQLEQQDSTLVEKSKMLLAKIESTVIDPLAAVFGPIISMVIDGLSGAFSVLKAALLPVTAVFQILGQALDKVGKVFGFAVDVMDEFLKKIGFGSSKTSEAMNKIIDKLSTVVAILIPIGITVAAIYAWEKLKDIGSGIAGFFSKFTKGGAGMLSKIPIVNKLLGGASAEGAIASGGLLSRAGSWLGKGGINLAGGAGRFGGAIGLAKGLGVGSAISLGGDLLGNAVGGRMGNTISGAATGVGIGATIGSVVPVIGTVVGGIVGGLVGAITSNWDKVKGWMKNGWATFTGIASDIFNRIKKPIIWISELVRGIADKLHVAGVWDTFTTVMKLAWGQLSGSIKSLDTTLDTKKQDSIAISGIGGSNLNSKVNALMKTREIYNTEVMKKQEQQMNQTFKPAIHIHSDLFGGYKIKAAGY